MRKRGKFRAVVFLILALFLVIGSFLFLRNFNWDRQEGVKKETVDGQARLESFYRNQSDYEIAFGKSRDVFKKRVLAGIISHHFLARDLMADFFMGIDPFGIENVYIVGPDHFNYLSDRSFDVATSPLDWQTPYGVFYSNQEIIRQLLSLSEFGRDDTIFKNDHSVYTLVPFVKKVFPEAKVIPLIIRGSNDYQALYNLGKKIYREKSFLIASVDFSHKATIIIARENDTRSINSLREMGISGIKDIEADCRECIALVYGFLAKTPSRFELANNKTSLDFGGQDEEDVTSYISGYFVPQ